MATDERTRGGTSRPCIFPGQTYYESNSRSSMTMTPASVTGAGGRGWEGGKERKEPARSSSRGRTHSDGKKKEEEGRQGGGEKTLSLLRPVSVALLSATHFLDRRQTDRSQPYSCENLTAGSTRSTLVSRVQPLSYLDTAMETVTRRFNP